MPRQITIDEENKKRILRYIKKENIFISTKDIELLEKEKVLTSKVAREITDRIKGLSEVEISILTENKDGEFAEEISKIVPKYKEISFDNMSIDDVFENMFTSLDLDELCDRREESIDVRDNANSVINSISSIDKYQIEIAPETKEQLKEIQVNLKTLLSQEKTDVKKIQNNLDKYNQLAMDIWKDYLTDAKDSNNNEYRWLIHNLSKGALEGDFKDKFMSTSILTNNAMGVFGDSNYGLIIKPKHIVTADYKDSYTNNSRENEDNLFMIKRPPLKLPQEIEETIIEQTIEVNGEILNYDKAAIYPEIVVDDFEIEGVYYISNGERELSRNFESAKKVAEERGVPLIERDISKYRVEHGLESMTEAMQKNFCKNIFHRCFDKDKELLGADDMDSIIDNCYKGLYEQYIKLKEREDYTEKDIQNILFEVMRGKEKDRFEREYGLKDVKDVDSLQGIVHQLVSDGILAGSNKQSPKRRKVYKMIIESFPKFEEFLDIYLKLREKGIDDRIWEGIDLDNVTYQKIFERAQSIMDEREKDQEKEEGLQSDVEQFNEGIEQDETKLKGIEQFHEGIEQDETKLREFEQFNEEDKQNETIQMQETDSSIIDLWMSRFSEWYSSIDKFTQNVKVKFVKMKDDIIKAIRTKIKERTNMQEEMGKGKGKSQEKGR